MRPILIEFLFREIQIDIPTVALGWVCIVLGFVIGLVTGIYL